MPQFNPSVSSQTEEEKREKRAYTFQWHVSVLKFCSEMMPRLTTWSIVTFRWNSSFHVSQEAHSIFNRSFCPFQCTFIKIVFQLLAATPNSCQHFNWHCELRLTKKKKKDKPTRNIENRNIPTKGRGNKIFIDSSYSHPLTDLEKKILLCNTYTRAHSWNIHGDPFLFFQNEDGLKIQWENWNVKQRRWWWL